MKFLTKFGQIALRVIGVVSGVGGVVAQAVPQSAGIVQKIEDTSVQIGGIIQQAELMGQALSLPGAQKLQAAAPAVEQVILQSAALSGHKVANPDLFKQGVDKITSGWADVINSLHEDGVQVTKATA